MLEPDNPFANEPAANKLGAMHSTKVCCKLTREEMIPLMGFIKSLGQNLHFHWSKGDPLPDDTPQAVKKAMESEQRVRFSQADILNSTKLTSYCASRRRSSLIATSLYRLCYRPRVTVILWRGCYRRRRRMVSVSYYQALSSALNKFAA